MYIFTRYILFLFYLFLPDSFYIIYNYLISLAPKMLINAKKKITPLKKNPN